jgi:murein L,D-transpeptidase YcbB/YkuD
MMSLQKLRILPLCLLGGVMMFGGVSYAPKDVLAESFIEIETKTAAELADELTNNSANDFEDVAQDVLPKEKSEVGAKIIEGNAPEILKEIPSEKQEEIIEEISYEVINSRIITEEVKQAVPPSARKKTASPSRVTASKNFNPTVKNSLTKALQVGHVRDFKFQDTSSLQNFYQKRDFKTAWIKTGSLRQEKANDILDVLEKAWQHGLNPANYRVDDMRRLLNKMKSNDDNFELDLALSDALVRYGRDMTGMRVKPSAIGQKSKYWRKPLSGKSILNHVADSKDLRAALYGLEPQGRLYRSLQAELQKLMNAPQEEHKTVIQIDGIIRPGTQAKSVLAIRERMGLNPDNAPRGAYTYDDDLAAAVMAFQKERGLKADGLIGPQTVNSMNLRRKDRINKILVNLERLRWMEPDRPDRYVMVNVPSAMLWAVANNKVALEMPVVVGRKKRPTKIFTTKISGIRFNPTWTVPPTIKRDDYLPKLRKDPYYLSDRGIDLMKNGRVVDPGFIDWGNKTWGEVNAMRMVQGSGSRNPLGRVRVLMYNPYNIYLHDTPSKSFFGRADRALSSGCVRMSKPQEFADFVLAQNKNWSSAKKDQIMKRGRTRDIAADNPIPVYIVYQTVWLGDRDEIVYGHDLYGEDRILLKELQKIDGITYIRMSSEIKSTILEENQSPRVDRLVKQH